MDSRRGNLAHLTPQTEGNIGKITERYGAKGACLRHRAVKRCCKEKDGTKRNGEEKREGACQFKKLEDASGIGREEEWSDDWEAPEPRRKKLGNLERKIPCHFTKHAYGRT